MEAKKKKKKVVKLVTNRFLHFAVVKIIISSEKGVVFL